MKNNTLIIIAGILFHGIIANAQTGFTDDFNSGTIGTGWQTTGTYGFQQAGGILKINCYKIVVGAYFTLNISPTINISTKAFFNIKLKADVPYILRVTLVDNSNSTAYKEVRVPVAGTDLINYCLDFSSSTIDKTKIKQVRFAVNYNATSFSGNIYFEDLQIGTTASKFANLSSVGDITVYKNSTNKKILITDILNADSITVSGGGGIIQNVTPSAISNGVCTITYDCINGATGTDAITVTAVGTGGFSDNTSVFNLTVEDNLVPTIDKPADQKIPVGKAVSIQLSGISDGNTSVEQTLAITASSSNAADIPDPTISYSSGSPYATLIMNAASAGTATITVTVKDNGSAPNDTRTTTFSTTSYAGFNYTPTVNTPVNQIMYMGAGTLKVKLTGITTGDGAGQMLTIAAAGINGVIGSAAVTYVQGSDTALVTLTYSKLGKDTITVTVTDDGGDGSNNGDQTVQTTFTIDVLNPAPTGYKVVMNTAIPNPVTAFASDTAAKLWTVESLNGEQTPTYVDTLGTRCIRIQMLNKSTSTGLWYNLYNIPIELDLVKAPYVSYEICAKGFSPLLNRLFLWDVDSMWNPTGTSLTIDTISSNIGDFQKVFFDFRNPGYLNTPEGFPINAHRISMLLINFHKQYGWPFTTMSGTVYIRDIRVGDSCLNVPVATPVCTVDPVPTKVIWSGSGEQTDTLTGISNGKGNTTGVTVTLLSSKPTVMPNPTQGILGADGKLTITYTPAPTLDSAQVIVRVNCSGSLQKEMRYWVKTVTDNSANAITINVDAATMGQAMVGFGGFTPAEGGLNRYVNDHGCTMIRLTIDPKFEAPNDNPDPNILDRSKFNKSMVDFEYIKNAAAAGVTDFFVTLWSTPSWMVQSLSTNLTEGVPNWNTTTQKVDPIYYDEYVEYMVAIVRMIKEETGVELAGLCPENEPFATQPYHQLVLDPLHYATVCGMLGKRLNDEGFSTKVINSEQIFGQGNSSVIQYINAVKADVQANQYTQVIGMHYPDDNTLMWNAQWTACKTGTYPKEYWATECETNGNNFNAVLKQCKYMITGLNYGCGAWVVWNYDNGSVGDENDATKVGGMCFGPGTSKHYWAFRNFAKYIRKGAVQLKSTSSNANISVAAFKHDADSTMTIVLLNTDTKMPYSVKLTGNATSAGWDAYRTSYYEKCEKVYPFKGKLLSLPPKSITTLVIKTNINHAPTVDPVADVKLDKNTGKSIDITGIGCGDPVLQNLTISVTSNNTAIIPDPSVNYTSPNNKAALMLSPVTDATGEATLTVIIKDDGGRVNGGIDADTIFFKVSVGATSINDLSNKVSLYPNPADEKVTLIVPAELSDASLIICNTLGVVVKEQKLTGESQADLNVSFLKAGMYYIYITNNNSEAKLRFSKN